MSDERTFTDLVSQSGWAIALLTASWGIILRTLIGKHFRKWDNVERRLGLIEQDLFFIKGRLRERDRGQGRRTWPGDSE